MTEPRKLKATFSVSSPEEIEEAYETMRNPPPELVELGVQMVMALLEQQEKKGSQLAKLQASSTFIQTAPEDTTKE